MSTAGPLRVLLLPEDPPAALLAAARPAGVPVDLVRLPHHTTEALHQALPHADIVVGDWSGRLLLGEAEARLAGRARLIQQPTVGVDTIDLDAFARRGVPVANTGSANARSVAEWCLGATMNLLRSYRWSDAQVRSGRWPQVSILDEAAPRELAGLGVGIVGAGTIALHLARMYAALDCPLAYWSPRSRLPGDLAVHLPLEELAARSDILLVAIARVPATVGLLGAGLVARLPERAIVVDVSRGGIVDHGAVISALEEGRLAGAAIDVYGTEPPTLDGAWTDNQEMLFSPHVAGVTRDAMHRTFAAVADNITAMVHGGIPRHIVNSPRTRALAVPRIPAQEPRVVPTRSAARTRPQLHRRP